MDAYTSWLLHFLLSLLHLFLSPDRRGLIKNSHLRQSFKIFLPLSAQYAVVGLYVSYHLLQKVSCMIPRIDADLLVLPNVVRSLIIAMFL